MNKYGLIYYVNEHNVNRSDIDVKFKMIQISEMKNNV